MLHCQRACRCIANAAGSDRCAVQHLLIRGENLSQVISDGERKITRRPGNHIIRRPAKGSRVHKPHLLHKLPMGILVPGPPIRQNAVHRSMNRNIYSQSRYHQKSKPGQHRCRYRRFFLHSHRMLFAPEYRRHGSQQRACGKIQQNRIPLFLFPALDHHGLKGLRLIPGQSPQLDGSFPFRLKFQGIGDSASERSLQPYGIGILRHLRYLLPCGGNFISLFVMDGQMQRQSLSFFHTGQRNSCRSNLPFLGRPLPGIRFSG